MVGCSHIRSQRPKSKVASSEVGKYSGDLGEERWRGWDCYDVLVPAVERGQCGGGTTMLVTKDRGGSWQRREVVDEVGVMLGVVGTVSYTHLTLPTKRIV